MDSLSDDILIQAANGHIHAFEQVYRVYAPFVYNVALRMLENKEDAEEITQEVFLILHGKLNSFMFRSSLKTWVYRITANCSLNFLKKRTHEGKGRVDFEEVLPHAAGVDNPRKDMEAKDQEFKLQQLLKLLNEDERACVVLRNVQGLSYQEIALSLNMNINTVRTRLKRAREKMISSGREVIANEM